MVISVAMMARHQRWDSPFGPDMTDFDVGMLMGLPAIAGMSTEQFPEHTPLAGILKNDTRLLDFKAGEIVVREGNYGNSAFLTLATSASEQLVAACRPEAARRPGRRDPLTSET